MIKHILIAGVAIAAMLGGTAMADGHATKDKIIEKTKFEVYGEVRAYVEGGTATNKDMSIESSDTKIGAKFNTDLNNGYNVFGELSADVSVNGSSDTIETRFGYVGLGHDLFGDLSVGKTMSLMDPYMDKADIFYNGGNQGVQKTPFKLTQSVKYENKLNIGSGLKFGLQTQMKNESTNETLDIWQAGVQYEGVGVVYGRDNINKATYMGLGASRDFGPFMLAGSVSKKDNDDSTGTADVIGYEIAGAYNVSDQIKVKAGFQDTDATSDNGNLTFGTEYALYKDATLFSTVDYDRDTEDSTYRGGISIRF